jgi:hypothetical protein
MNTAENCPSGHFAMVTPYIYIGSKEAVLDENFLESHSIGLIVKCDCESTVIHRRIPTVSIPDLPDHDYIGLLSADNPLMIFRFVEKCVDLEKRVAMATEQIHEAVQQKKRVLVHCWAGINRSAFTIGMYLKKYQKMPVEDILNLLTEANKTRGLPVLFNKTFLHVLKTV